MPGPRQDWSCRPGSSLAAQLLRAGIPLTLLMDLASPAGPHSQELYADERVA